MYGFICSFFQYCFIDYLCFENLLAEDSLEKRKVWFLKELSVGRDKTKATLGV